ncbi:phosphorylase superfamily domain-containing protein [Trichoderma breve]|uniref:Phosphorylase superfamily domain-containing protein n=1 Tax=Trichoderma breve TaxID=2034170 RepID=A0A9W9E1E3_9HYPO|nr:phosphorylase superfamily domain-containing protein [Trichoderma breve]KAJ4854223.1 phosphorylase superfamily domain-containing protein [Trichoderma breve]
MLPTESLGWIGFQALKVRLVGRLAPFASRKASVDRPTRIQNDADLLDCDLRDILKTATLDVDLSVEEYHDLHQRAHGLLVSLDHMVNEEFIGRYEDDDNSLGESHDIAKVGSVYPRLAALMLFLDASNHNQFDLLSDPSSSLFTLPSGAIRNQAVSQIAAWKAALQRLIARSDQSQSRHDAFRPQMRPDEPKPKLHQNTVMQNPVGIVMDAIFKEFQQVNCGMTHEIKLRVLDESHTDSSRPKIEMLMSCCQSGCDWQEAVCDSIQAPMNLRKKNNICIAIHETWKQRTKLRLFFDQRGLFDITDEEPPMATSLHDYEEETLNSLFDKNMFRPISPGAYLQGLAIERFDHKEKTSLALALARCLMVFFDKTLERAFCNWNANSIFIMRSARSHGEPPWWHILVRSRPPTSRQPNIHDKIGPGNPILLSFAKLLLEIVNGEPIKLEVDPQNINKNIGNWAQMCGYVEEARQDRNSFYLQAVQGCLYLHMHLQRGQDEQTALSGIAMREVIYEQIVRNLEKELHPEGLKRKRRGSFSEPSQSNKVYITEPLQLDNRHEESFTSRVMKNTQSISLSHSNIKDDPSTRILRRSTSNFSTYNSSEALSNNFFRSATMTPMAPPDRDHFDVAIICAIPTEYNAICQIFDEFWDEDGDRYGRAAGDLNTYTTGRIGKHNVVLALLPQMGKSNAAAAAASFRSSYNNIELALLVGVCGGVPRTDSFAEDEILLGDVVISRAVVQYDFGKASKNIQGLLNTFETDRGLSLLQRQTAQFLTQLQNTGQNKNRRTLNKYRYPGTAKDRLFRPDYRHKHRDSRASTCTICSSDTNAVCEEALGETCEALGCEESYLVERERLQEKQELEESNHEEAQEPAIHIGAVASGDTVLKSGEDRDNIAAKEGVIAFEMEGAGIWGEIPCIIVKGVCDYADSHKNKRWQDFAAATAAAAAKALLHRYPKTEKTRYE